MEFLDFLVQVTEAFSERFHLRVVVAELEDRPDRKDDQGNREINEQKDDEGFHGCGGSSFKITEAGGGTVN